VLTVPVSPAVPATPLLRNPDLTSALHEHAEHLAHLGRMSVVQVNLPHLTIDTECDCLCGWTASDVILNFYLDTLCHGISSPVILTAEPT
jgi:hypothetical protein